MVQSHGVGGGKDSDVFEFRGGGVAVAIAVDGEVVHDIDVDNLVAEMVGYGCCGSSHALKEFVLVFGLDEVPQFVVILALSIGVDVGLSIAGSHADALVFQHTAKSAHGMTLEVGKVNHEIVVL